VLEFFGGSVDVTNLLVVNAKMTWLTGHKVYWYW
jgi:hypothetical protein